MQCDAFHAMLPDLQLRNVEPAKETEAKSHASACKDCGALLTAERELDAAIGTAALTVMPPTGAAARAWRVMVGGPSPVAKLLATAAAVLLLATAAAIPFVLGGGTASAEELIARATELHRLEASQVPTSCCGDLDTLDLQLPADPARDDLLPRAARHGWRFADAHANTGAVGGVRLAFRKRDILLTCLMVPDKGYELRPPQHANGHTYHVYQSPGLIHLVQRLADGRLCILSADTSEQTLADLVLSADADRPAETAAGTPITWRIGNVHCDRCAAVVRATLENLDGVARAPVEPPAGGAPDGERRVKMWLALRVKDRTPVLDAARAALEDAGFPVLADR